MPKLPVFFDEAGQQDMSSGYYLLTLVLHNQEIPISSYSEAYEQQLIIGHLPHIPFHMVDLIHGHGDYEGLERQTRKALLGRFNAFVRTLPISYKTFPYHSYDCKNHAELSRRMRKDIVNFIFENLALIQTFENITIYYDGGQQAVTNAIHEAFGYMFGDRIVEYRLVRYPDRYLSQVADYLCSIELAAMRYEVGRESQSYKKFFGLKGNFKKDYLKKARRKALV